ncbi:hypothetical protein JCM1841_006490 [Sporobolomyces salmonicolor]
MKVITQLRQLINASLDAYEAELTAHGLPDLDFEPVAHQLDNPDYLTPPKLFEARRAALSGLSMLTTLIKPAYQTACIEGPCGSALVAAYAVVVENGIATLLADPSVDPKQGLSAETLGKECDVDAAKLARMLRILTSEGVFTELSEVRVSQLAASRISLALVAPSDCHSWAMLSALIIGKSHLGIPEQLRDAQGRVGFNIAFNCSERFFPWVLGEKDRARYFNEGMGGCGAMRVYSLFRITAPGADLTSPSRSVAGLLNDYPYETLPQGTHLVDVAGGQGSMSFPIIAKHNQLELTIQDQEDVLPAAQTNWEKRWKKKVASDRFSLQAHNFLEPNPISGDNVVYMLRWIIHDWPAKECVEILKNLRSVMSPKSKILIMDSVIMPPVPSTVPVDDFLSALAKFDNDAPYSPLVLPAPLPINGRTELMVDANMMTFLDSQERTTEQLQAILDAADLELIKLYRTRGSLHISEVMIKGSSGASAETSGESRASDTKSASANEYCADGPGDTA